MCGIVGFVGNLPERKTIERAANSIAHRGPDDAGLFYDQEVGVAFGHRRLSIIDLSVQGHQPMWSNDGRYVIVFNGEIYNYLELKQELKGSYDFRTETDTEVLLAAFGRWREKCLEKLNGMFSFVIWDKAENKLFGARDRLGIKPFFYSTSLQQSFCFASEIKSLLALGVKAKENERIIFDYLAYGYYDHSQETFFEDIFSLKPGHYFYYQAGNLFQAPYWQLEKVKPNSIITFDEAEEQFKSLLADSIKLQFRSDVPVGINLSSGLDSNTIYHFALAETQSDIHTFSMCASNKEYDECDIINSYLTNKQKDFWHHVVVDKDLDFSTIDQMNLIQDQPYGGMPTIIYLAINSLAKKVGVTVLLEGQGLDELLAGYKYYLTDLKQDLEGNNDIRADFLSQDMTKQVDSAILSRQFLGKFKDKQPNFLRPFESNLLNAQYRDLKHTKLPRVLRFNDHASMAYGRELRVPFLDHRIVEFCFSLPAEFKIKNNEQKFLIRKTMKGIVPDIVLNKPKKAFGAIQSQWLKGFETEINKILSSESFKNRPYWDHEALDKQVRSFFSGQMDNSFFIWQCLNLEKWFNKFID